LRIWAFWSALIIRLSTRSSRLLPLCSAIKLSVLQALTWAKLAIERGFVLLVSHEGRSALTSFLLTLRMFLPKRVRNLYLASFAVRS
jgi:hypothetical protein